MFYQIFFSTQVKWNVCIKIAEQVSEQLKTLQLETKIKKYEGNLKTSLNYSLVPSITPKIKI